MKALIGSSSDRDDDFEDVSERPRLTLRQLRLSNIEANTHDHTWKENAGILSHKFAVGDFGYIPEGEGFEAYVKLGNIYSDELVELSVESHTYGTQWCWKDMPVRRSTIDPYELPDNVAWSAAPLLALRTPTDGEA